jgi:drug/metabolite transporter (DMT)-like permease
MTSNPNRAGSLLQIHAAVVLFGLAGLFGKWLSLSPLIIVLGRVVFASLTLGIVLLLTGTSLKAVRQADRLLFLFLGVLLAVHWTAFFLSVQVSTVAVGLLSYSSFPVFTAFLEPAFFKKKLDPVNTLFAGICLLGVFLIIPRFVWTDTIFKGVLFGLASGLTFSVLSIINRGLTERYSCVVIAFWQDFVAALVLLPFLFILSPVLTGKDIGLLLILGIVCTAGSHTLFIDGLRRITAQAASIISALEPVYGIVLAYLFLRESPALRTLLGGAVILAAVTVISIRTLRPSAG